jgi:integrase
MSRLAEQAGEYLRLRQALGHKLDDAVRLLPRFVAYLDTAGVSTITVEAALAWVQQPAARPVSSVWARRMTVARGFARYMSGLDPATEVPPLGLVTFRKHWRPPFIYSGADVEALMAAVPGLVPSPFRAATFQTMTGLLAVTGMRAGEVISLGRCDVDWAEGLLVVRNSKFGKSREVLLDPTTVEALACYARLRNQCVPRPASPAFFLSAKGTPVVYTDFGFCFRKLLDLSGVGAGSPVSPRIHDLRH